MLKNSLANILIASFFLKRNLDWHRRAVILSFPVFLLAMMIQSEYTIYRIKKEKA
ncbi:hypothetical protein [Niallia sp. 01092]|uniref:hypothetical protein n=1 Tax=unclassified Niallia TaxID=2837522 RepID=UPI003FD02730